MPLIFVGLICTNFSIGRPDLVDLGKSRVQSNAQNLEMAFDIAEKEFGVTKLLDPEGKTLSIQNDPISF